MGRKKDEENADALARERELRYLLQQSSVDKAREELEAFWRTFNARLEAGERPSIEELSITRRPRRQGLSPPYSYRVDEAGDVFLCGWEGEVKIPFNASEKALFMRIAKAHGQRVTLRALHDSPPTGQGKKKWSYDVLKRDVARIRDRIASTVWAFTEPAETIIEREFGAGALSEEHRNPAVTVRMDPTGDEHAALIAIPVRIAPKNRTRRRSPRRQDPK